MCINSLGFGRLPLIREFEDSVGVTAVAKHFVLYEEA